MAVYVISQGQLIMILTMFFITLTGFMLLLITHTRYFIKYRAFRELKKSLKTGGLVIEWGVDNIVRLRAAKPTGHTLRVEEKHSVRDYFTSPDRRGIGEIEGLRVNTIVAVPTAATAIDPVSAHVMQESEKTGQTKVEVGGKAVRITEAASYFKNALPPHILASTMLKEKTKIEMQLRKQKQRDLRETVAYGILIFMTMVGAGVLLVLVWGLVH